MDVYRKRTGSSVSSGQHSDWYFIQPSENHFFKKSQDDFFMIKNSFYFFKGNRHYLTFISFERLGFISGTPSVRSRADCGARIFPSVNICRAIWVPEHLACHSSSVSVCRSHRQQNTSSSFLSDSGFILIQTLPCRSPWWPVTCVARRLVRGPWKRV